MTTEFRLALEELKQSLIEQGLPVNELDRAIELYEAQVPIMPGKAPNFSGAVEILARLGEELKPTRDGHELSRMVRYLFETQEHFEKEWGKS
jgi:hypothetical protein